MSRVQNLFGTLVVAAMAISGCGSSRTAVEVESAESELPAVEAVEIPGTPVGERTQWIIDLLNGEDDIAAEDFDGVFAQVFLDAVETDDVLALLNSNLRTARPYSVIRYEGTELQAVTTVQGAQGEPFSITLSLSADHLIDGFFIGAAEDPNWEEPESVDEVAERLAALPVDAAALVTRGSETLIEIDSGKSVPLGSTFKLYVLLAVTEQIAEGTLTWEEELTLTDTVRSLPSGKLQDEPTGTKISVFDAAMQMISISDNTATDMLIGRLGREAVEQAVVNSGHHQPTDMQPFLTTKNMFELGWGPTDLRRQWEDGDTAARRRLVAELDSQPVSVAAADVSDETTWTEGLEWFASANDIAAVHEALNDLDDPKVREILSANPGVNVDGWAYAAYKGGSNVGVLTTSWLLEGDNEQAIVVVMARSEDAAALASAQMDVLRLAQATIRLIQ